MSVQLAAQDAAKQHQPHQYHHYQIADPGTFGGPQTFQNLGTLGAVGDLNNQGAFAGSADTSAIDPLCFFDYPDCYAAHAFVWQNGTKTDLGLIPGGTNSQVNWISANGLMTGGGDNGQFDPILGIPQIRGTLWAHDGSITEVGALPGTYFANPFAVNDRGEVVGAAMNTIPDSNSIWGIGYQTRAFYWENGVMQDLGTLGTGTDALAGLINERGQVVGNSYTNAIPSAVCNDNIAYYLLTTGAFIWDKKNGMKDLGGFGGTCTLASDLNNRGQVVGGSALPGDSIFHPFVWDAETGMTTLGTPDGGYGGAGALNENGDVVGSGEDNSSVIHALLWRKRGGKWRMTDLGTFAGGCPFASSVNASAQVVGFDQCAGLPFLSEDGAPIVDLNTLVPSDSGLQLNELGNINDRGEISINGWDGSNNHSVVLIPCDENHSDVEGCDYSMVDAATAAVQGTPAKQRPAELVPGTRMPGMLNRFRSPKGRPVPGRGIASATASSSSLSATTDRGDLLGDHRPLPQYGAPPLYCAVSGGVLTGTCVESTGGDNCNVTFTGCPIGLPANSGGQIVCGGGKNTFNISQTKCFNAPGFDLSASALTPTTVSAGSSATSTLTVSAYGGFGGSVTFTCVVQPTAAPAPTCSFSPSSVTSGIPATLTVSTIAPTAAFLPSTGSGLRYALWLPLFGVLAPVVGSRATRKDRKAHLIAAALVCMLFVAIAVQVGCGSTSPKPGTPPGQYTVTVTGTSGSVMSSAAAMLTVQ
jgi:probable HAF family extracellular repeat protein